MNLNDYASINPKEHERSFDFFVKRDYSGHYVFSIWYNSGKGDGSGVGEHMDVIGLLSNELTNLELNREESDLNTKPIKARFHGKTLKYYSLEELLKIYARSEGVPIDFEYLPPVRRRK